MTSIYLVNPISGRGHLDSYARLYSRALVELGYEVTLVAETDGETGAYLARTSPASQAAFSFISFEKARRPAQGSGGSGASQRASMTAVQRAHLVWREEGAIGLSRRCARVPRRVLLLYIPRSLLRRLRRLEQDAVRRLLRSRLARTLNLAFYLDAGRILFQTLLGYVHNAATLPGRSPPDMVFFLYLDLMAERGRNIAALDRAGAWPWIGILFHPRLAAQRNAKIEGYFKSANARGGVFLVPAAIPIYADAAPSLSFALAPDVADLELPVEQPELARDIRRRAGGRTVVLQIGSIAPHKGIATLLDVIALADPTRFFFAFVGEVHWASFADDEKRVRRALTEPPENVFVYEGYVASEIDYNSLIDASDIVYAVYQNFNSSSNSLTKAAGFRRPILVSANSLMGQRVLASGTGSVAPENEPAAILAELGRLATRPKESFSFDIYHQAHSLEALKAVLADAMPRWLAAPPGA